MFQATITPLLWLILTCNAGVGAPLVSNSQQISPAGSIPSDMLITLERTGCEGPCPIYTLKVSADGVVVYRGKQFVRTRRRVKSRLTLEQLRLLLSEFDKANYVSLRDRYQSREDGCSGSGIDYAGAITSIRVNGRSKTITHDYGCRERLPDGTAGPVYPKALFELEQRIDEIVGTKQWTK